MRTGEQIIVIYAQKYIEKLQQLLFFYIIKRLFLEIRGLLRKKNNIYNKE